MLVFSLPPTPTVFLGDQLVNWASPSLSAPLLPTPIPASFHSLSTQRPECFLPALLSILSLYLFPCPYTPAIILARPVVFGAEKNHLAQPFAFIEGK